MILNTLLQQENEIGLLWWTRNTSSTRSIELRRHSSSCVGRPASVMTGGQGEAPSRIEARMKFSSKAGCSFVRRWLGHNQGAICKKRGEKLCSKRGIKYPSQKVVLGE